MSGLIAIVGRPNVGKSALFNRMVGRRIAIVHDQPGVTRDRVSAEAEWRGRPFTLVDTGGIGLLKGEKTGDPIIAAAVRQVEIAIDSADVILFVGDAKEGIVPLDREVADRLRISGKPVLVLANKVDEKAEEPAAAEFAALGFGPVFGVSAIHDRGLSQVLDAATARLPRPEPSTQSGAPGAGSALKLAIIGRPNVGKSSIVNALTRSERVIVSPVPGTTRDSVDVPFTVETEGAIENYVLIDTAGIRKERRIDNSIEFFSVKRAEESIERSDLVVFVLDAESGILEQDKKVADKIVQACKACVIVINKWDLVEAQVAESREEEAEHRQRTERRRGQPKPMTTLGEFGQWVQERLFFLDYAPVIFTSAKSGFHLDRLLEAIRYVTAQLHQRIPTSLLNRTIQEAVERKQPVSAQGHFLKFFYATQLESSAPTFLLFVNKDGLFSEPYRKYLSGQLRKAFGFEGCPIVLQARPRPKKVESIRKNAQRVRKPTSGMKRRSRGRDRGPARSGKRRAAEAGHR